VSRVAKNKDAKKPKKQKQTTPDNEPTAGA